MQLLDGGNGLGNITAWYGEDGIHLSHGKSARYDKSAQVISWQAAAERIGELLGNGQFGVGNHQSRGFAAGCYLAAGKDAGFEICHSRPGIWIRYEKGTEQEAQSPFSILALCKKQEPVRLRFAWCHLGG